MKARVVVLATALLAAASTTGAAQAAPAGTAAPAPTRDALRAEVTALNRAMEQAFARGDLAAVARFYADDGRLVGPRGQLVEGRAAIDAYWLAVRNPKSWRLEVLDVGGSPDDAYQLGRSTLVTAAPAGEVTSVSQFVVVWRRGADGRLRIVLDFYHF